MSGGYRDASTVIAEALRLLEKRDALDLLRADLQTGLDQIECGETIDYTPRLMERLLREGIEDATLGRPVDDAVRF